MDNGYGYTGVDWNPGGGSKPVYTQSAEDRWKEASCKMEKEMLYYKCKYLNLASIWPEIDELLQGYSDLLDLTREFLDLVGVDLSKVRSKEDMEGALAEVAEEFNSRVYGE